MQWYWCLRDIETTLESSWTPLFRIYPSFPFMENDDGVFLGRMIQDIADRIIKAFARNIVRNIEYHISRLSLCCLVMILNTLFLTFVVATLKTI